MVSINTSKAAVRDPRSNDPWFQFFFGDQGSQAQAGLGSGVIISQDGYILTNNHVVEGADEIDVTLSDSRRARARTIGTDPRDRPGHPQDRDGQVACDRAGQLGRACRG